MSRALEQLSENERSLLLLKYEQGKSLQELAQLYNLGLSAVEMRLKRSRKKVQRFYLIRNPVAGL